MKYIIAVIASLVLVYANVANATMEAAWTNAPDGETIHHQDPHCPNFIAIKRKDGTIEEHVWAHESVSKRSSVDSGECVFN